MESNLIIVLIACFVVAYFYFGLRKMCFSCFRWNGLKVTNSAHSHTETNYRTKDITNAYRDANKRIVGYKDEKIQESYNVNYNQVTYECINCERQIQRILTPGKYLKETIIVFIICFAVIIYSTGHYKKYSSTSSNDVSSTNTSITEDSDNSTNQFQSDKTENEERNLNTDGNAIINQDTLKSDSGNLDTINSDIPTISEATNQDGISKAIDMLKQDKSVGEIKDATSLTRKEIRQLRRKLRSEE